MHNCVTNTPFTEC